MPSSCRTCNGRRRTERPSGALDAETSTAAKIGALLPEGAIVSDEAITSGLLIPAATAGAPRHDWLFLTGGAIGQGMPVATGAALACPDRKVLCLEADGSAMYTLQSLENQGERTERDDGGVRQRQLRHLEVGTGPSRGRHTGPQCQRNARSGSSGSRLRGTGPRHGRARHAATDAQTFTSQLEHALAEPGPSLVEALLHN